MSNRSVNRLVEIERRERKLALARAALIAVLKVVASQRAAGPGLRIASIADVTAVAVANARGNVSDDVRRRNIAVLRHLDDRGTWRPLQMLSAGWRAALAALESLYPHFAAVFGYLRGMCALAERGDGVFYGEHMLFAGTHGTGKSSLAEQLAPVLGGAYQRICMSVAQSSSLLGGAEAYWSTSDTGVVFKALVDGAYANPVLLLDELDKVSGQHHYDPLGPLYQLLEPTQARHWADASMPGIPLDTSRIVWIATANEPRLIPAPLLQRFVEFHIPEPTTDQCHAIVASVDAALKRNDARLAGLELDESAVDVLAGLAPRDVRKRLHYAYGQVAYRGGSRVRATDLPLDPAQTRRIGF